MNSINFPFIAAKNIGKENFLKWQKFYKIRQGNRNCFKEEGLWRRTQEKINKDASGWKIITDKKRRIIHYEHSFDVLKKNGSYDFCLTSVYLWLHLCLPSDEIEKYHNGIIKGQQFSKWWRKVKFGKSQEIYKCGDLFLEIKKLKKHPRDIEAKRKFPSTYEILEITLRSKGVKKSTAFKKKPWLVLNTGVRTKDKRGNPEICRDIREIIPHLPAQVELGGGASIESGVYPLHFLHEIYSVSDEKKKFVFSFEKDNLIHMVAGDPYGLLKNFSAIQKSIILSRPGIFYEKLRTLHKKNIFVGPIITNNFDGFVRQIGLKERYIRRYSDNVEPRIKFHKKAKSLLIVGVHADRRRVQKTARAQGLKIIYIDLEGFECGNGDFIPYLLESPQNKDIIIRKNASHALEMLEDAARVL